MLSACVILRNAKCNCKTVLIPKAKKVLNSIVPFVSHAKSHPAACTGAAICSIHPRLFMINFIIFTRDV